MTNFEYERLLIDIENLKELSKNSLWKTEALKKIIEIMEDLEKERVAKIEALTREVARLNDELKKFKDLAFKARISDPNFDKPLSEIEVNYEIIKK